MLKMVNPGGGFSWIHESRLDEYEARGFKLAPPPPVEPKPIEGFTVPKPAPKKRKSTKKEG